MSLKRFIKMPDVAAKLKPLRPKLPRKLSVSLGAEPRSNRYTVVGSAFDYFLRFELQRRAPHAVARRWVAELAIDFHIDPDAIAGPHDFVTPHDIKERTYKVVQNAKAAVKAYVTAPAPTIAQQLDLAAHAVRIAKLDSVCRAGPEQFDPGFEHADQEDVDDLLAMLDLVPFDSLIHPAIMLLNPTFGKTSSLVGGADADLITGDMLVDFKTTKASEMQVVDLDQLLGYFLLARHERKADPNFPDITRLALYFCRHGYLWVQDVKTWTNHPQFAELEEWFFKHAKEVFPTA